MQKSEVKIGQKVFICQRAFRLAFGRMPDLFWSRIAEIFEIRDHYCIIKFEHNQTARMYFGVLFPVN